MTKRDTTTQLPTSHAVTVGKVSFLIFYLHLYLHVEKNMPPKKKIEEYAFKESKKNMFPKKR